MFFLWDQSKFVCFSRAILTNPDVQVTSSFVNIFRNDFWGTPLSSSNSHGSYRPLCTISFRLNHWISGFHPFGYHLTNVILHAVATILVLQTARVLLPGKAPTVAASLFAVHPIHVEAVAGIVGRADVLATVLFLISFLFYVEHLKRRDLLFVSKCRSTKDVLVKSKCARKNVQTLKPCEQSFIINEYNLSSNVFNNGGQIYFVLFVVFAVCAMLSKEPSITVIPLAICYDIILHLRSKRFSKFVSNLFWTIMFIFKNVNIIFIDLQLTNCSSQLVLVSISILFCLTNVSPVIGFL